MNEHRSFKKPLLYALVASVVFGAVLGIVLVLRNTWGWYETRVMLTTVIVAVASVFGLACDLSKTPFGSNWLPKTGLLLTALTAVMLLAGLWLDFESDEFWRSVIVVTVFCVATVHVSLLSIARLTGNYRWVYLIGCQVIYGLAGLISAIVLFSIESDALWRFVAALTIVDAAITLIIPILHRIARMGTKRDELLMPVDERNVASIDSEIDKLRKQIAKLEKLRSEIVSRHDVDASDDVRTQGIVR